MAERGKERPPVFKMPWKFWKREAWYQSRIGKRLRQYGFHPLFWWGAGGRVMDVLHDEHGTTARRLKDQIKAAKTISERRRLKKKFTYEDFFTRADVAEMVGNISVRGVTLAIVWTLARGGRPYVRHGYLEFPGVEGKKINLPERSRRVNYRTASWGNILREGGIRTLAANLDGLAKAERIDWNNLAGWKGTAFEEEWEGFRKLVDSLKTKETREDLNRAIGQFMIQTVAPEGSVLDYTKDVDRVDEYQESHGIKKMDLTNLKKYFMEELGWNEDDWKIFETIYKAKERSDTQAVIDEYMKKYPLE